MDTLSLLDVILAWLSTVIAKLSLLHVPVSSLVSSLLCIVLLPSTLFLVATVPAVRQADCRPLQRRLPVPRTERRQRLPRLLCHWTDPVPEGDRRQVSGVDALLMVLPATLSAVVAGRLLTLQGGRLCCCRCLGRRGLEQ